jgi:hypothetical protein
MLGRRVKTLIAICSPTAIKKFKERLGVLAVAAFFVSPVPMAQTITVRLLHAKTGKPLLNKNVTLLWSPDYWPPGSVAHTGKDGVGSVQVPLNATLFSMEGGPKEGSEPYRIPFIACNGSPTEFLKVSDVLNRGIVPKNSCSGKNVSPKPGEIVFWALPKPWWQPDMQ